MNLENWQKYIKQPEFWILATGFGLLAFQTMLGSELKNPEVGGTSMMALASAAFLLTDKKEPIKLKSNLFSRFFGGTILALIFLRMITMSVYHPILRIAPLIIGVGVALMLSGAKGFKQFWKELVMLCLPILAPAPEFLVKTIDITLPTAKVATMLLWYLGYPVLREGIFLHLPTGSVEVGSGCSGMSTIMQLLGLSFLVLFSFTTTTKQKIMVPVAAAVVAFFVNSARVALMAVLAASSNPKSFEYWHFGEGSVIFSMIAVAIFGLFCWFTILREEPPKKLS
ncbi:MAG TPA: cyanoexosortase A [Halomicronema sp.]